MNKKLKITSITTAILLGTVGCKATLQDPADQGLVAFVKSISQYESPFDKCEDAANQCSKEMLVLGNGNTSLANQLSNKHQTHSIPHTANVSSEQLQQKITKADLIHIDLAAFSNNDKSVNDVINECLKQMKPLILENSKGRTFTSLPIMLEADVVLYQPSVSESGDKLVTFGSKSISVNGEEGDVSVTNSERRETPAALTAFKSLTKAEAKLALDDITSAIDRLTKTERSLRSSIISNNGFRSNPEGRAPQFRNQGSGGVSGYPCTGLARQEKLCISGSVTGTHYRDYELSDHTDEYVEFLNSPSHFSYAAFRTHDQTLVAISPYGSSSVEMEENTDDRRSYFLKWQEITVEPTAMAGLNPASFTPTTKVSTSSLSSTSGIQFSLGGEASDSPSLGATISLSSSNSISTDIEDWKVTAKTVGTKTVWKYEMNAYKDGTPVDEWTDIVDSAFFNIAELRELSDISTNSLAYTTEATYVGSKDLKDTFKFEVNSEVKTRGIWFTKNNRFDYDVSYQSWYYDIHHGSASLNLGKLKKL